MAQLPRGLYAITDSKLLSSEKLVEAVALAIQGGAQMIQYRNKGGDAGQRQWEASDINNMCRPLGVPLIINDDVEMAVPNLARAPSSASPATTILNRPSPQKRPGPTMSPSAASSPRGSSPMR